MVDGSLRMVNWKIEVSGAHCGFSVYDSTIFPLSLFPGSYIYVKQLTCDNQAFTPCHLAAAHLSLCLSWKVGDNDDFVIMVTLAFPFCVT